MNALHRQVEFRSGSFPAAPGEERLVNPGRWGKALAEFLQGALQTQGLPAGTPRAEDWGWVIPLEHERLWIGCGNRDESPDGFLCFIEPEPPGQRQRDALARVADALDRVLRAHPDVQDILWCAAD